MIQLELWPRPNTHCRRCGGSRTIYYVRSRPEVVGGKRVPCPECVSETDGLPPPQTSLEAVLGRGTISIDHPAGDPSLCSRWPAQR